MDLAQFYDAGRVSALADVYADGNRLYGAARTSIGGFHPCPAQLFAGISAALLCADRRPSQTLDRSESADLVADAAVFRSLRAMVTWLVLTMLLEAFLRRMHRSLRAPNRYHMRFTELMSAVGFGYLISALALA
jgi:hypothetical protein